jgi:UDP-N-acetylmuramoyl-tripeptide--D-alanyl-D-alanine ligase
MVLFIISWLYIFQLKEYRYKRILDFFTSKNGIQFLLRPENFGFPLIAILFNFPYIDELWPVALVIFIWMNVRLFSKKISRPVTTKKATIIAIVALILFYYSLYWFNFVDYPYTLLYLLLPVVYFFLVQLFQIPTYAAKRYYIAKATKKLATYTNLRVIGITGSYGKTSTRNFLVQVLSTQYRTVTTPKNINTEIGVARFILDHDFSSDDIFVVEMGAYAKGEIKLIADMVQPEIGIITTIGPEHLALFGTIENIRETKAELFGALPKGGLAITNADNSYCREIIKANKHLNIQTFGTSQLQHPSMLITHAQQQKDGIIATFNYEGQDIDVSAPLFGTHNAANIAAVLLAAEQIGMKIVDIVLAIQTLISPPHRLHRIEKTGNVVVLDDSYNSNPEGFLEAIDVLAMQEQKKKVVITRGMLELGTKEEEEHVAVGKRIGEVADMVIIISADNALHIKQGIATSRRTIEIVDEYDMRSVVARYRGIIEAGNVAVLLENRVPDIITNEL